MSFTMKNLLAGSAGALVAIGAFAAFHLANPARSYAATRPVAQAAPHATPAHVDGNHFTLDGAPAGDCTVGATCTVSIKLAAQAEYHINQQYPYKFTAQPASGVTFLGADAANPQVFTKTAGDFAIADEKTGAMTVKFKPTQKGPVTITGTFKLSVCSSANCQLEQQDVAVTVAVK